VCIDASDPSTAVVPATLRQPQHRQEKERQRQQLQQHRVFCLPTDPFVEEKEIRTSPLLKSGFWLQLQHHCGAWKNRTELLGHACGGKSKVRRFVAIDVVREGTTSGLRAGRRCAGRYINVAAPTIPRHRVAAAVRCRIPPPRPVRHRTHHGNHRCRQQAKHWSAVNQPHGRR